MELGWLVVPMESSGPASLPLQMATAFLYGETILHCFPLVGCRPHPSYPVGLTSPNGAQPAPIPYWGNTASACYCTHLRVLGVQ